MDGTGEEWSGEGEGKEGKEEIGETQVKGKLGMGCKKLLDI